jgi:hypothetical protein
MLDSTNLSCDGKYQDFRRSAIALRRLSDMICIEHGLSIVEKPGLSKGHNRREYLGQRDAAPNVRFAGTGDYERPPSGRDTLRDLIDENLIVVNSLTEFITKLKRAGVEIKHGKQFSFRPPGNKKFFRQDTLGDD